MSAPKTIRPVSFKETISSYRTVNTVDAMGRALMEQCDPNDPAYRKAAASLIAFQESDAEAEQARADSWKRCPGPVSSSGKADRFESARLQDRAPPCGRNLADPVFMTGCRAA